jgi:hypothetical protein
MIYLFYGSSLETKKKKSQKVLSSLDSNQILQMNDLDFSPEIIGNMIYGDSLFDPKEAIVFSGILENKDALDFILSKLDKMNESPKIFIFLEQKLLKEVIEKFKKAGAEIEEFKVAISKADKANPFTITYPIGSRDKKNIWISFQKVIQNEAEPEALAGIFFWKIKSMILEKDTRKYSERELIELSSKIISIYHEGHRGVGDIETGLERLILESM